MSIFNCCEPPQCDDLGSGKNAFTDPYTATELSGNEPYKISSSVDTGYVNISSIENWWWFYQHDAHRWFCKDYKFYRYEIAVLASVLGWSNLSQVDKEIAASIFAVGSTERDEIFTLDEQIDLGIIHHHRATQARISRLDKVQIEIYNRIDKSNWFEIATDLEGIKQHYLEEGREGTVEGDAEGIFDYVDGSARPGTSWDGNTSGKVGVRDKTFSVLGFTDCAAFADHCLDVLKDGLYKVPNPNDELF